MRIRLRLLSEDELNEALENGTPLIKLYSSCAEDNEQLALLEYEYGEGSAEGSSWTPVEVF